MIGWGFGWLTVCYLAIAVVACDNALASTAFMPLFGIHADEGTARLITVVLLVIQAVVVVASTRLVGRINGGAVVTEFVVVVALTVALVVALVVTGGGKKTSSLAVLPSMPTTISPSGAG